MTAYPSRTQHPGPRAGEIVGGRYRLDELLGAGGTADVFQGTDLQLPREVAIKVFRPGATAVTADGFCKEAVLLGRLTHPALVPVYDMGRHEGGAYVVMHLIKGATLRERLTDGPLSGEQVARLGVQLASALAHVHAAGIIHRDVKPSNILLGPDDAPYLADFGLSRLIDEPSRAEPGTVVGTAPYLSPEQVLGKGSGPASDIYGLGLVLLEALKGEREYQGAPPEVGTARLIRPPEISRCVPEPLASVIEAMTHTEPSARPEATQCVQLLQDAYAPCILSAAGEAVALAARDTAFHRAHTGSDHPATPPRRGGLSPRRRRVLVAALAAGALLGAAGATLSTFGDQPATPDAAVDHPTPSSSAPALPSPSRAATPVPPSAAASATALALAHASRQSSASPSQGPIDTSGESGEADNGPGKGKSQDKSHGKKTGQPAE
ncbi:serine/threonine-protein kinase [Streptomyces sp. H10-C2]|uniref:serine/threonine-protein kinase n=1 Tax=unclassified Streptomyces TaxID=2593676 RepID=UPI0024B94A0A|nr:MULTISPECIES: serine/threonine-protein kinase [unclassified Streptomyces]MDJ0345706.1 serine/threonine-protein kinase [Streptomyces sp. PH10-H1]MDJ0374558.1 serine/threonine-protein kinase [Streptomyces sp. H10-C2]